VFLSYTVFDEESGEEVEELEALPCRRCIEEAEAEARAKAEDKEANHRMARHLAGKANGPVWSRAWRPGESHGEATK